MKKLISILIIIFLLQFPIYTFAEQINVQKLIQLDTTIKKAIPVVIGVQNDYLVKDKIIIQKDKIIKNDSLEIVLYKNQIIQYKQIIENDSTLIQNYKKILTQNNKWYNSKEIYGVGGIIIGAGIVIGVIHATK